MIIIDLLPYLWQNEYMALVKTTLRIEEKLKKEVAREALEKDTSFQEVVNRALEEHIQKSSTKVKEQNSLGTIDTEIHDLTKDLIKQYRGALEELASK